MPGLFRDFHAVAMANYKLTRSEVSGASDREASCTITTISTVSTPIDG
jgi:hypothetical protein